MLFSLCRQLILYKAAQNAIKKEGNTLYLTATSTDELDKRSRKKEIIRYKSFKKISWEPTSGPWNKISFEREKNRKRKNLLPTIATDRCKTNTNSPPIALIFVSEIELGQQFYRRT